MNDVLAAARKLHGQHPEASLGSRGARGSVASPRLDPCLNPGMTLTQNMASLSSSITRELAARSLKFASTDAQMQCESLICSNGSVQIRNLNRFAFIDYSLHLQAYNWHQRQLWMLKILLTCVKPL